MKYIELFAGIGGFRSALDKLEMECVFSSEIDKYATLSYKTLYGDNHLHGDITKIKETDIPNHDLLVGGFPCQAFSVAGKRRGFDDTRGTLFFEIARIAKEKQPTWLLLENVKGLLSHDEGKTFETMCQVLNEIGYVIDFNVLNSKYFDVPQNRERIFIIANKNEKHVDWNIQGNDIVAKTKKRIKTLGIKTFNFHFPKNNTITKKLRDILQQQVIEKYYISPEKTKKLISKLREKDVEKLNNIDTQRIVQLQGDRTNPGISLNEENAYTINSNPMSDRVQMLQEPIPITNKEPSFEPFIIDDQGRTKKTITPLDLSPTIRRESHGNEPKVVEPNVNVIGRIDIKGMDTVKRVYDTEGLSPTITTCEGGYREPKIAEIHTEYQQETKNIVEIRAVLTPDREEKRQNGRRFKENDEEMFTITAQDIHGIAITQTTNSLEQENNHHQFKINPHYRIRKLTPLECWRLQGFSDSQFKKCSDAGLSDSQLYKQAGNAVTVNVVHEIGKSILKHQTKNHP